MTTDKIKDAMHTQPFHPFDICLADGRKFRVKHPDFVARDPSGWTIIVYEDDGRHELIDLSLVTSLSVSNGQSKRRGKKPRAR